MYTDAQTNVHVCFFLLDAYTVVYMRHVKRYTAKIRLLLLEFQLSFRLIRGRPSPVKAMQLRPSEPTSSIFAYTQWKLSVSNLKNRPFPTEFLSSNHWFWGVNSLLVSGFQVPWKQDSHLQLRLGTQIPCYITPPKLNIAPENIPSQKGE